MIWDLRKLEKERRDLIEVVDSLKSWQRFSPDNPCTISLQVAAHMMRLSELDEDLTNLWSEENGSAENLAAS